jgi:transposase InsO family protein
MPVLTKPVLTKAQIGEFAEMSDWLHRYNWHRPRGSLKPNTPMSRLGPSRDILLRLHA